MTELIFIVEIEYSTCLLSRACLEEEGFAVRTFSNVEAIAAARDGRPSLMLIASTLKEVSGLELCRQIRRDPVLAGIPVILMTAGNSEEQSCAALESGADNCLAKPFTPRELIARVHAALRRGPRAIAADPPDIVIDHVAMKLSVRGSDIATTTLEFRLVDYLAKHRGHVFTRDALLDAVWGKMQFVTPRSVDACIRRVREKIERDVNRPSYLKTIRGVGYRFDATAAWPVSSRTCNCAACAPMNALNEETSGVRAIRPQRRSAAS